MEKNQQIQTLKLIEGTFSPKETQEILMSIFSSKLKFHQMKNFSSQEQFGINDKNAEERMKQLKKSFESILKISKTAEMNNKKINIQSDVILRFIEKEE